MQFLQNIGMGLFVCFLITIIWNMATARAERNTINTQALDTVKDVLKHYMEVSELSHKSKDLAIETQKDMIFLQKEQITSLSDSCDEMHNMLNGEEADDDDELVGSTVSAPVSGARMQVVGKTNYSHEPSVESHVAVSNKALQLHTQLSDARQKVKDNEAFMNKDIFIILMRALELPPA